MTLVRRVIAAAAAAALLVGVLVWLELGRGAAEQRSARAAAEAALPPVELPDSIRYKAFSLRHRDEVVAQRRAAARELRRLQARTRALAAEQERLRAAALAEAAEQERRRAEREAAAAAEPRPSGGLIVGDSVSLGAERCLTPLGYRLDSEVGRQFAVGLQRLRIQAGQGLPDSVVVHLGTNGPFGSDGFAQVMDLLGSQRRVVWVTIALPDRTQYSFRDSLNAMIRSQAALHDNVRVADFSSAADEHPEWFYADGVHINAAGCTGYAEVVDAAVTAP